MGRGAGDVNARVFQEQERTGRMKTVGAGWLVGFGFVTLAAGCVPAGLEGPQAPPGTPGSADLVDDRELVALVADATAADRLAEVAVSRGLDIAARDALAYPGLVMLTLRLPEGRDGAATIREIETAAPGSTVGFNHAYRPDAGEAVDGAPRLYANALIRWPDAGCAARLRSIGMIDTPVDAAAARADGVSLMQRPFGDGLAPTQHGTAVLTIIVGEGRLKGADVFVAAAVGSVASQRPAAGVDDIMRATSWLGEEGVRLVNVSLAGPYNKILDRGLGAAAEKGMIIVAAAGNDGAGAPPRYPAAFDFAIAVTAVDADRASYQRAPRGAHIDFAAPGVDVFVPVDGGRYMTGTSFAAPFVTALIAADSAAAAARDAAAAGRALATNAVDLGSAGVDTIFGAGLPVAPDNCRQSGGG